MKIVVKTNAGETMDFDLDAAEPLMTLKCLIESVNNELSPGTMRLVLKGNLLADDEASLGSVGCQEGDVFIVCGPQASESMGTGAAPTTGPHAVQIVVSECTNEKTNGVFLPAAPHNGKACWRKPAAAEGHKDGQGEGEEQLSKDQGERVIFYSTRDSRWYASDDLSDGGFTFVASTGEAGMPPLPGWQKGAIVAFRPVASAGEFDAAAGLTELTKLMNVEWEGQEVCYLTMLKVLQNIVAHPGEEKYCSLKVDNAAIQNKILKFDGARGFLEAVGFREVEGSLVLPVDRTEQADTARELLQGYANEANIRNIRKERHAKAAEEMKKEAARPKARGPQAPEGGGPRFGKGPMRGGGG